MKKLSSKNLIKKSLILKWKIINLKRISIHTEAGMLPHKKCVKVIQRGKRLACPNNQILVHRNHCLLALIAEINKGRFLTSL